MPSLQPDKYVDQTLSLLNEMESKAAKIRNKLLTPAQLDAFSFILEEDLLPLTETVESETQLLSLAEAILKAVDAVDTLRQEFLGSAEPIFEGERALSWEAFKESKRLPAERHKERTRIVNRYQTGIKKIIKLLEKEQTHGKEES